MNFPNRRKYAKWYIILKCALLVFLVNQILGICYDVMQQHTQEHSTGALQLDKAIRQGGDKHTRTQHRGTAIRQGGDKH